MEAARRKCVDRSNDSSPPLPSARRPLSDDGSYGAGRRPATTSRKSLTGHRSGGARPGTRLDYATGVDREIAASERRRRVGVRVMVTVVPVVAVVLLIAWLPDLLRPGLSRARIRTARVTTGPVDAV